MAWRLLVAGTLVTLILPTLALAGPTEVDAAPTSASPYALVSVSGASLSDVTVAAPFNLTPAFSPSTTDYAIRCHAGSNQMSFALTGNGGSITVGTNQRVSVVTGGVVEVSLNLVPNQAVVIYAPDPAGSGSGSGQTEYWLRCLPPDFPAIQVNQAGTQSSGWTPGYYFTGNLSSSDGAYYAMALDGNGIPVWYQQLPAGGGGPVNVQLLPNDTIAWTTAASGPGIGAGTIGDPDTAFDLTTQSTSSLPAAVTPTDPHELTVLPNGDRMMISTPVESLDLSSLGEGTVNATGAATPASAADNTISDCIVQEVNSSNQAVWSWDAAQHVGLDEVTGYSGPGASWLLNDLSGGPAADIFHCNSVAVDEDAASPTYGDVLVSMRHLNAVFLIDRTTGNVIWKMGGTNFTPGDPEEAQATAGQHLSIVGDSETAVLRTT